MVFEEEEGVRELVGRRGEGGAKSSRRSWSWTGTEGVQSVWVRRTGKDMLEMKGLVW